MQGTAHIGRGRLSVAGAALVATGLLGCSGSDDEAGSFTCDVVADRSGAYRATFDTANGNCEEQYAALSRFEGHLMTPEDCVELDQPVVRDDGCTLEVHRDCKLAWPAETYVEITGVTTQQDEDGDTLAGTMTLTVRDELGELCHGTYRTTATKQ